MDNALLVPLFVQVGLTLAVMFALAFQRVGQAIRDPEVKSAVASGRKDAYALRTLQTAENFGNLFETPVLFYVAVAVALATATGSGAMVVLAWAFVIARIVHTIIHCTVNVVRMRFLAFLVSVLALVGMWIALALGLAG